MEGRLCPAHFLPRVPGLYDPATYWGADVSTADPAVIVAQEGRLLAHVDHAAALAPVLEKEAAAEIPDTIRPTSLRAKLSGLKDTLDVTFQTLFARATKQKAALERAEANQSPLATLNRLRRDLYHTLSKKKTVDAQRRELARLIGKDDAHIIAGTLRLVAKWSGDVGTAQERLSEAQATYNLAKQSGTTKQIAQAQDNLAACQGLLTQAERDLKGLIKAVDQSEGDPE
jgi:hypothetical protein